MPHVISLIILALAVSLDGFGVGLMYGFRRIKIPLLSVFIISICSGIVMFIAMLAGDQLAYFLSIEVAETLGSVILIGLGTWAIFNMLFKRDDAACEVNVPAEPPHIPSTSRRLLHIEISKLGLVIDVLKRPATADMDRSGNISAVEAILLGSALSLDAFGAGIGAAFIQLSPWTTPLLVSMISGAFLLLGLRYGASYAETSWMRRMSLLPGILLILIGIIKLL